MAPLISGSVEKLEAVLLGRNKVLPGSKTRASKLFPTTGSRRKATSPPAADEG